MAELTDSFAAPENAPAGSPGESGDLDDCWIVPALAQAEIMCWQLQAGHIDIEQGRQRIHVCAENAVRLARRILFAAGFDRVTIATRQRGGYVDLDDGDLAVNFDYPARV